MEWEGTTYQMMRKFILSKKTVEEEAGKWVYQILTWDKRYPRVGGGGRRCDECDVNEFRRVEGPFDTEQQASEHLQAKLDKWRG